MAIHKLQDSNAVWKVIVFDDDMNKKGQSFVEAFVRKNRNSLSGIQVWRHRDETFELFFERPDQTDAHVADLATELLVDQSRRATMEFVMSFTEIAERICTTPETLRRVAGTIETRLKNDKAAASLERDYVRFRQN